MFFAKYSVLFLLFQLISPTVYTQMPVDNSKIEFRALPSINFNQIIASGYSKDTRGHRMFLYVARKIELNGDIVCGQYIPKARLFYWIYMDTVNSVPSTDDGLEILYYPRGSTTWVPEDHPLKPDYVPIACGWHSKIDKRRFFCRSWVNGELSVGQLEENSVICNVPSNGTFLQMTTYEILIESELGKMIHSYMDDDDDEEKTNLSPCWLPIANLRKHGAKPLGYELRNHIMFEFFLARFSTDGGSLSALGKYSLKMNLTKAMFSHNGKFYMADNFDVLDFPQGTLSWVTNKKTVRTSKPDQLIGLTNGKLTIACRAKYDGNLILGQYNPSKKACEFPYMGKPESTPNYELLAINDYGISVGVTQNITQCSANRPKNRIWGGRSQFL